MRIYYHELNEDLRVKVIENTEHDITLILEYRKLADNWYTEKEYHAQSRMLAYGIVEHIIKPEYL